MDLGLLTSIRALEIPSEEKLLLMILASYTNGEMKCWPAIETIAGNCGKKKRIIQRQLQRLEEQGLLRRERRHNHSNVYDLRGALQYTPRGVPQTVSPSTPVHSSTPGGAAQYIPEVYPSTPKVSIEGPTEGPTLSSPPAPRAANIDWRSVKDRWNDVAKPAGITTLRVLNDKHKSLFKKRTLEFKQAGEGEFFQALLDGLSVPLSEFARGKSDEGTWKIDLMYALGTKGSGLILGGHYADTETKPGPRKTFMEQMAETEGDSEWPT